MISKLQDYFVIGGHNESVTSILCRARLATLSFGSDRKAHVNCRTCRLQQARPRAATSRGGEKRGSDDVVHITYRRTQPGGAQGLRSEVSRNQSGRLSRRQRCDHSESAARGAGKTLSRRYYRDDISYFESHAG